MRRFAVFLFLVVPLCGAAQDSEITLLKEELEALKHLNELYVSRIEAVERRLAAYEQGEPADSSAIELAAGQTPGDIPRGASAPRRQAFSSGFDSQRFDYYGYMRAGYGVDEDGTSQSRYKAPGALAAYRLGNEIDTYMETGFSWYNADDEKEDPPVFGTHFMIAYATPEKNTFIELGGESGQVSLREAYATARNLDPEQPDSTIWAGQRYYRSHDVHINDFFWLDMSGFGGGIEDYDAGFAKVSVAWIGGTTDNFSGRNEYIGDLKATDKNNFDFRFNDIDLGGLGKGNFWLNYSKYRFSAENLDLTKEDGWSGGFWLVSDNGKSVINTAVIQYGTGVAANFNSFSPSLRSGVDGEFPEGTVVGEQSRLRLMDFIDFKWSDQWTAQALLVYQHDDLGLEENTDLKWYSVGFRPVYSFSELYNLALEASYDYTDLEDGTAGGLWKLTAAGEITPDMGFFSRPAIRFYLTYAGWSDEFRGLIGGLTHEGKTSGAAMGVQFESWW